MVEEIKFLTTKNFIPGFEISEILVERTMYLRQVYREFVVTLYIPDIFDSQRCMENGAIRCDF